MDLIFGVSLFLTTSFTPLDERMDAGPPSPGFAFVDVGQGACLVIIGASGEVYVVDSGPPEGASALLDVLAWSGRRAVDLWTHTHFDDDHVGAFAQIVNGPDGLPASADDWHLRRVWDRGEAQLPSNLATSAYTAWVDAHQPERGGELGSTFTAPHWWVSVVAAGSPGAGAENERGLALCGDLLGTRFFIQGDLPASAALGAARGCGPVDLYWLGHHGSKDALDAAGELLRALEPGLVVISSGNHNPYCHPHPHTLERLQGLQVVFLGLPASAGGSSCGFEPAAWTADHQWRPEGLWVPADGVTSE